MKCYLATTSISEFWDLDSKLLLLGPWCLTSEKSKRLLKDKDYIIIPSPWKPTIKIKEAADYCHEIYEGLLTQLSENLNSIHRVSYPVRYWRVLIGPWLLHFIGVFFDRYRRIENALEIFPDLYTHVLPIKQCKTVAFDTYDFVGGKVNEDYYNLKLFSLVCYELCPERSAEKDYKSESKIYTTRYGWKRRLFNRLIKPLDLLKYSIVLSDMYHLTPSEIFLLKWKTGFKIIHFKEFCHIDETSFIEDNYSYKFREALRLKGASNRFQSLLYKVIPEAIPMCYMENYEFYRSSISGIDSVRVVGSATGWYFNERFKFFAAEAVSKGANLIDFQHGGGYGLSLAVPVETISLEKDIFYTWGWNKKNNNKIKPLLSPHLSRFKDTYSPKLDKILFVGITMPKYHYRFHTQPLPEDMPKYFEDKKIFFQFLSSELKNRILYRPYLHEYGWDEKKFVKEICPYVEFLLKGKLVNWMKKVKLVVIDHPHTSFLEVLTINVPGIFYWDHDVYLMRPKAERYFELLRDAGILYKSPESAAKKVNEIYNDPLSWWQNPEVQKAKDEFCNQFARTSKNWRKEWAELLRTL